MRQGPNGRRPRGRHHHSGDGNNRNGGGAPNGNAMGGGGNNRPRSASALRHQNFDSNGPDVRVRGNAWQVYEKYQALARDASGSGDHVTAESLLQHAEHYYRIIEAINEATAAEMQQRGVTPQQPFGQQPETPANYYAPDGSLMGAPAGAQPQTATAQQPQPTTETSGAVVTPARSAAATTDPFFTPEEAEEPDAGLIAMSR